MAKVINMAKIADPTLFDVAQNAAEIALNMDQNKAIKAVANYQNKRADSGHRVLVQAVANAAIAITALTLKRDGLWEEYDWYLTCDKVGEYILRDMDQPITEDVVEKLLVKL